MSLNWMLQEDNTSIEKQRRVTTEETKPETGICHWKNGNSRSTMLINAMLRMHVKETGVTTNLNAILDIHTVEFHHRPGINNELTLMDTATSIKCTPDTTTQGTCQQTDKCLDDDDVA